MACPGFGKPQAAMFARGPGSFGLQRRKISPSYYPRTLPPRALIEHWGRPGAGPARVLRSPNHEDVVDRPRTQCPRLILTFLRAALSKPAPVSIPPHRRSIPYGAEVSEQVAPSPIFRDGSRPVRNFLRPGLVRLPRPSARRRTNRHHRARYRYDAPGRKRTLPSCGSGPQVNKPTAAARNFRGDAQVTILARGHAASRGTRPCPLEPWQSR